MKLLGSGAHGFSGYSGAAALRLSPLDKVTASLIFSELLENLVKGVLTQA